MIIYTADEYDLEDQRLLDAREEPGIEAFLTEVLGPDASFATTASDSTAAPSEQELSVAHFCQFVDEFTSSTSDPLHTTLICEQQAEAVNISPQEVTPETIHLLMETLLASIDHLEKKWLDTQIQLEEQSPANQHLRAVQASKPVRTSLNKRQTHGFQQVWHTGKSWLHRLGRRQTVHV